MAEKYLIGINGDEVTYEVDRSGSEVRVLRDGDQQWNTAHLERVGGTDLYLLLINNHPTEIYLERRAGGALVTLGRHTFDVDVRPWRAGITPRRKEKSGPSGVVSVKAPMTGTIIDVSCSPGDTVEQGDVLLIVEAMKMNNELTASTSGTVEHVAVLTGDKVRAGDILLSIKASVNDQT